MISVSLPELIDRLSVTPPQVTERVSVPVEVAVTSPLSGSVLLTDAKKASSVHVALSVISTVLVLSINEAVAEY